MNEEIYVLTFEQAAVEEKVNEVLRRGRFKKNETTIAELLELGFHARPMRVTWSGGVGSRRMMRGGVLRIQVCAATWGYRPKRTTLMQGKGLFVRKERKFWKYAKCIEIKRNGHEK